VGLAAAKARRQVTEETGPPLYINTGRSGRTDDWTGMAAVRPHAKAWRNQAGPGVIFSSCKIFGQCPFPECLMSGVREYRAMPRPVSEYPDNMTVYLVVNEYGQHGRSFVETDIAEAGRRCSEISSVANIRTPSE
jgi:hypothetical protein